METGLTSCPLCHSANTQLQTPFGAGLSLCLRGNPALALRSLRDAILFALAAVSYSDVRALQHLRQPGIATHLRGAHHRSDFHHRTLARNPGFALRPLPAHIFFMIPPAPRRATSSLGAKRIARR